MTGKGQNSLACAVSALGIFMFCLLAGRTTYAQLENRHIGNAYPVFDSLKANRSPFNGFILPIEDMMSISRQIVEGNKLCDADPDSAIAVYKRALIRSARIGYKRGIRVCLVNIATCMYSVQQEQEQAVPFAKMALRYDQLVDRKDKQLMATAYRIIALDYFRKGIYDSALNYYHKIIAFAQTDSMLRDRTLTRTYSEAGAVLGNMGELPKAMAYFRMAVSAALKQRDTPILAEVYMNMGTFYKINTYYRRGRSSGDSALYYYGQALRLYQLGKDTARNKEIQDAYGKMISIWIDRHDASRAKQLLDSAIAMYPQGLQSNHSLLMSQGYVYFAAGNFKEALPYYRKSLDICREKGLTEGMLSNIFVLAYIYNKIGNDKLAYRYAAMHAQLKDSLQGAESVRFVNELEMKYQVSEKNRQLATKESKLLKAELQGQRKSSIIWVTSLCILLLVVAIVFVVYRQLHRLHRLEQSRQLDAFRASMDGEEAERIRVGQELHDGVSGLLSAIKMNLVTLRLNRRDVAEDPNFTTTVQLADEAADELRKVAHNLVPSGLVKNGIGAALKAFCEKINMSSGNPHIKVEERGVVVRWESTKELVIYRIVQELIHNILKHSGGTEGVVSLSWQEKLLLITVEDNGNGIQEGDGWGIGLENIKKRVNTLNGVMDIESRLNEGTSVYLEFSL